MPQSIMSKFWSIIDSSLVHTSGLKPGQVIWVTRVTFHLGQADLTQFIKYLGLTWILHWITCIIIMASDPNQSNELSMLDGDDGSVLPDFQLFSTWIMHCRTPQKHRATITIFTSFYIKFKCYFSVLTQRVSSNAA